MASEMKDIPAIFRGAKEYRDDPDALELAQATFNEAALYRALASFATKWHDTVQRAARVLDLCSATGLSACHIAEAIPVRSATLVDLDGGALRKAPSYFTDLCELSLKPCDAVNFRDGSEYDIIVINSAYHHIEDDRKQQFLRTCREHLAQDGVLLVGEQFLPPYSCSQEFRSSIVSFYTALIRDLELRQEPAPAINVIRRSGLYCWQGVYEYKVSYGRFLSDVAIAGLQIERHNRVWPHAHDTLGADAGTVALTLTQS